MAVPAGNAPAPHPKNGCVRYTTLKDHWFADKSDRGVFHTTGVTIYTVTEESNFL